MDESTIQRCKTNILEDCELDKNSVAANFEINPLDGKNYKTKAYTIDVLISIGFHLKSKKSSFDS